ncbi:unnamed protein product [Cochlearia groenlandica]
MKMTMRVLAIWMILLCHVLCFSFIMSYNRGIIEASETLKHVEDFEIEQELKLINKPAVKIIKSIHGERYGCVDFYKQPGFDHPSMNNMRLMRSYPNISKIQNETLHNNKFGHLWENGVGCPIGTVPIRRTTKEDLLRLKSFDGDIPNPRGSWNDTFEPMTSGKSSYHFAVIRTKRNTRRYNGASMTISIHTPPVQPNQISSARMLIQMGYEFVQAGWTVSPLLYGDDKSRLFVFTNAGGHACYHTRCPTGAGMILVRHDLAPGLSLTDTYYDIDIAILKDKINQNWFLYVEGMQTGFWPSNRFIMSSGTRVEWGGEVYSPPTIPSPPMGNGHLPVGNPKYDSYMHLITTVDENYVTDKIVEHREPYTDNDKHYRVSDATETFWRHFGHLVCYGGPGKI